LSHLTRKELYLEPSHTGGVIYFNILSFIPRKELILSQITRMELYLETYHSDKAVSWTISVGWSCILSHISRMELYLEQYRSEGAVY